MPANRHRRRAAAARARGRSTGAVSARSPFTRFLLVAGGLLLIAVGIVLLLTPRTSRSPRGPMFAVLIGGALLVSAFVPGRG
jgi:hypothetical protein